MGQIPLELLAPYQVKLPETRSKNSKQPMSEVERLLATFAAHERRERDSLQEYHESADTLANPLVKFLLKLIISDEEKHHDIVRRLLSSLEAELSWNSRSAAIMPALGKLSEEDRKKLLALADTLIAEEKQGIAEYKAVLKSSKGYYDGLMELLVDTVILDSKKHLMILRFLKQRLKKAD